jgi:3D (Asp-Asp-Asp) domain-containing protein
VDSEVSRYSTEIDITTKRQAEIQASIEEEQRHLDETKQQLNQQQAKLEKRLRETYKSDDVTFLSVMLGANDFSDFLTRVDALETIAESDRQLINSINESKKSLEEKINSLAAKQQELAKILESLNAAQQNLIAAKEQQQSVVNSLQAQKLANEGQLAQLQSEAASIEARMNQLQSQSSINGDGNDYNPPPAGGTSFTMIASAYCLAGRTATGMPVGRGIIAVDPSVIPLGTRVHVSGYGDAIAADTGGAISGNRIDVWLPCDEAYAWGVRTVTVTVY